MMRKFLALTALTCFVVVAFAQNAAGSWKGKVKIDMSTMPKAQNAQQQAQLDAAMKQLSSMVITLVMKPNKTFTISAPGMGGQKPHSSTGTWSQKGNQVTLTTVTTDGKPEKNQKPMTATITPNGKTMTVQPDTNQKGLQIIFSK